MIAMAKNMSFCEEERSKVQKVFEGLISEQEESQLNAWIERCWNKEIDEEILFAQKNPAYFDEVAPPTEVVDNVKSMLQSQNDIRNKEACSLKAKGNVFFQRKDYRCAMVVYQTAINIKPPDQELLAVLYNNLSAALFYLKHFGASLQPCEEALKINPGYEKAKDRAARCRQNLRESLEAFDSEAKMMHITELSVLNKLYVTRARIQNREMNATQRRMNTKLLIKKIQQRNYQFVGGEINLLNLTPTVPELQGHRVVLIQGQIIWPVFIMFPDFARTYIIRQFAENERFQDVICELLPLDGDCCQYLPEFLQVYFIRDRNMFHFSIKKTLEEILSLKDYLIVQGTPDFVVFVKGGKQELLFLKQLNLISLG